MELRRKRPIYDLNKPEDRAYLLNRGFVWAVIYPARRYFKWVNERARHRR
jgi:hypothetical protein